ncbi:hypothetical protein OI69_08665 [Pectobacterium fontis]|uniref:Uncharacterized protein n=1 Tax=Pectobacterium fontis TaxID=2558042 RepID=A0A7V8L5I5_9GAMM|nr:hypothetical protein OI69_08665 [Pectobacterium fontis]
MFLINIGFQEKREVTHTHKNTFFDKTYFFIINNLVFSLVRQIHAYVLIFIRNMIDKYQSMWFIITPLRYLRTSKTHSCINTFNMIEKYTY